MTSQTVQTENQTFLRVRRGRSAASSGVAVRALLVFFGAAAAAGCGDDSDGVALTLTEPSNGQVLTLSEDDADSERTGLQFDVLGTSRGIEAETPIRVLIDDKEQEETGSVGDDGRIRMPGVTLPPGTHRIQLETSTGSVSSADDHEYTYKALVITTPLDGAELSMSDDDDAARGGVQISVKVTAFAIESEEDIELLVDGTRMAAESANAMGEAVFTGVNLTNGTHKLQARTKDGDLEIESSEISVEVSQSCAAVQFLSPEPPEDEDGSISLGGEGMCPESGQPFRTRVEVTTDAGDGRPVQLFVNGQPVALATVDGTVAVFKDVALSQGSNANSIQVDVENAEGVRCRTDFPGEVFVDCAGAGCKLKSPMPVSYVSEDNELSLYLNSALRGDDGYTIEVESDKELVGKEIQLVIDRDTRKALKATAVAEGNSAVARFEGVDLDEGAHRLEGLCTDSTGNVTTTDEFSWTVDLTACDIDITAPAEGTVFVPADDEDAASDGTQVVVTSSILGDDCVRQRAHVCDPDDGIEDGDFAPHDGSASLLSSITLDDDESDQSLCVEIQDRAGNNDLASVEVSFRASSTAPRLVIESPEDGAKYNVQGGSGYIADANSVTAVCEAEFSIACTEIGADVALYHDEVAGEPFATAPCEEPEDGDAELPSGYAGRAKVTANFEDGDQSAVIVAAQSIAGTSSETLEGVSDAITIEGDCRKPVLLFSNDPCGGSAGNQLTAAQAAARDIAVSATGGDIGTATLAFTNDDGSSDDAVAPDASSDNSASWNDVDLGGAGTGTSTVVITVTAEDDFDNIAVLSCMAEVVSDLPQIVAFTAPANNAMFGPGMACNTGTAGEYGVRVTARADQQNNRTATVEVNGDDVAAPIAANGDIDICVPVPDDVQNSDDPSEIVLRLAAPGGGSDEETRTVSVRSVLITSPTNGTALVPANDCDSGAGFGAQVMVSVDPIHAGANYMLSGSASVSGTVAGNTISECVPIVPGPNTITATVGGISYSVAITLNQPPTTGIVIDPLSPMPTDPDYRDGVTATWPMPTGDFANQLVSYAMRCDTTSIAAGATQVQKDAWWAAADAVTLPGSLTPDDANPEVFLPFRVEHPRHCVLRAADGANQLTPIVQSTDLTLKLRQLVLSSGPAATTARYGLVVAPLGDVDDDGIDDILVGSRGRAELIFGSATPASASKVVFVGPSGGAGRAVGGIGDINEDGRMDFAIGDPFWNGNAGRVSIFLGRARAQWPTSTQDIETSCNADFCLDGTGTNSIGRSLVAAGDFNGDNDPDFAIGAPFFPTLAAAPYPGQVLVVMGGCAALGICGREASGAFFNIRANLPSGDWVTAPPGTPPARLSGFVVEGAGALADSQFGIALAALGAFDGGTGDDLAIGANKAGQVHFLSGRAHGATAGFETVAVTQLGVSGQPGGTPIATGSAANSFGSGLGVLGNFFDPAGSGQTGITDLAVADGLGDLVHVHPGERLAAGEPAFTADDITLVGNAASNLGFSIASSTLPYAGQIGDLDDDGRGELLADARGSRQVVLLYATEFAANIAGGNVPQSAAGSFGLTVAAADSMEFAVQFSGDFNNDGLLDLVIGNPRGNANRGEVILLY